MSWCFWARQLKYRLLPPPVFEPLPSESGFHRCELSTLILGLDPHLALPLDGVISLCRSMRVSTSGIIGVSSNFGFSEAKYISTVTELLSLLLITAFLFS